jgi:hypothetical protein
MHAHYYLRQAWARQRQARYVIMGVVGQETYRGQVAEREASNFLADSSIGER